MPERCNRRMSDLLEDYKSLVDEYEKPGLTRKERRGLKKEIDIIGEAIESLAGIK